MTEERERSAQAGPREADPMRRWESLVERQIREALDDGRFEDLPHQGSPLPRIDDAAAGEWALAYRMLKDAGAAPPWIEADKAVRLLLERRERALSEADRTSALSWAKARTRYGDLITELDAAITRLNAEAPTDRQQRRPVDVAAELAAFDARRQPR